MNITGAIVLYAVIWFLTFYIVLQVRTRTQGEAGEVVPGTPAGAPATEDVGRSARIATLFATLIWAALAAVILSGRFSVDDMNIFGLRAPVTADQ
jgi:predicted secreted protein